MADCKCMENPDAVNKINWVCIHGNNLKAAFESRKKKAEEFYRNQAELETKARNIATNAYNKIFKDEMRGKD